MHLFDSENFFPSILLFSKTRVHDNRAKYGVFASFASFKSKLFALPPLGLTLTCVVLHHVLVVSVGGLGEVHAHALDPLDAPHGRVPPGPKQGQLGLWVHVTAGALELPSCLLRSLISQVTDFGHGVGWGAGGWATGGKSHHARQATNPPSSSSSSPRQAQDAACLVWCCVLCGHHAEQIRDSYNPHRFSPRHFSTNLQLP